MIEAGPELPPNLFGFDGLLDELSKAAPALRRVASKQQQGANGLRVMEPFKSRLPFAAEGREWRLPSARVQDPRLIDFV
jgi:hypothetical protein